MQHVLLIAPSAVDASVLDALGCVTIGLADLDQYLGADLGRDLDAVVVGAAVEAPLRLVQRIHRALPAVGILVCTTAATETDLRRQASYAPDVPATLRLVPAEAPELEGLVEEVAHAAAEQRRHESLLAAVAVRSTSQPAHVRVPTSLGSLLDHAPFGVLVADTDEHLVAWNRHAEKLLDLQPASVGQRLPSLFSEPESLLEAFALARIGGLSDASPTHTMDSAGTPVEVTAFPTRLENGRPAVVVLLQDVAARHRAEASCDRLAAQVGVLADVSEALAGTLDGDEALRKLADQVVPTLGDWVVLQTYDERGEARRVAVRHRDAQLTELAEQMARALPPARGGDTPSERIGRGEGPIWLPHISPEQVDRLLPTDEARHLVQRLGAASVIAVALPGRQRALGSMVLVNGPESDAFTEQDVAVAVEVGRRAGVALETVGLFAEQRDLSEQLQRGLLSEPVEPDHGEIAVRYVAAAEVAQVGGDWYDSFLQEDGATVLVIGDVIGHDTRAAAAMGQLRNLLRGIGYTTGTGPAEMLRRLDDAIEGLMVSTTATAAVARLEQCPELFAEGRTRLRWSNAGHPPPALLPATGPVRLLEEESNLLLGVLRETNRDEHVLDLDGDSTLLLYTDGLVERRSQGLETGLDLLVATLEELRHLPLNQLCDELLARMLPAGHDDDVALVAIRLHTQDQPRPVEAGPQRVPDSAPDEVRTSRPARRTPGR